MLRYNVRPRRLSGSSENASGTMLFDQARNPDQTDDGSLISLGSLAFRERRVVLLIRELRGPGLSSTSGIFASLSVPVHQAFQRLAREAKAHGIQVFPPEAPFLSLDENTILHRIAALQRPSLSSNWCIANTLQEAMKVCADVLAEESRRLPARAILQDRDTSRNPSLRIECSGKGTMRRDLNTYTRRRARRWDGLSEPPPGTLQAKALEIVRRHPIASTAQFLAVGITHQYLSALHHRGFVERIGHGFYSFPSRLEKRKNPSVTI